MFGDWGTKDHDESIRIYSAGESEETISRAMQGRPAELRAATR
jgi:hypothetical protein